MNQPIVDVVLIENTTILLQPGSIDGLANQYKLSRLYFKSDTSLIRYRHINAKLAYIMDVIVIIKQNYIFKILYKEQNTNRYVLF